MSDVLRLDQSFRLLLVDDEPHLTDLLSEELVDQGYQVEVASTISEAWQFLHLEVLPELLVLDWSLPDGIGPDLCERMREDGIKIPVLMLTGHDEVSDRVLALDAGVDDYLVKPFSIDELLARLRALQRRRWEVEQGEPDQLLALGKIQMNITAKTVSVDGSTLLLLKKEYELLEKMMLAHGRACAVNDLLLGLWQEAGLAEPDVLDVYLRSLQDSSSLLTLQCNFKGVWPMVGALGQCGGSPDGESPSTPCLTVVGGHRW